MNSSMGVSYLNFLSKFLLYISGSFVKLSSQAARSTELLFTLSGFLSLRAGLQYKSGKRLDIMHCSRACDMLVIVKSEAHMGSVNEKEMSVCPSLSLNENSQTRSFPFFCFIPISFLQSLYIYVCLRLNITYAYYMVRYAYI